MGQKLQLVRHSRKVVTEKENDYFGTACSKEEKKAWRIAASLQGISMAKWAREALNEKAKRK